MTVRIERDGVVATVVLSRPEVRNAVDRTTALALADAFREVESDGLVHRVVGEGKSRTAAEALAREIAVHPQICLGNDRRSVYESASMPLEEALRNEFHLGLQTLESGESVAGARRFADRGDSK